MNEMSNQGSETLMAVTYFLNSVASHFESVFAELGKVLEAQARTEDIRALGQYIAKGGKMTVVNVDDRIKDDLCQRLEVEHIGHLCGDLRGAESVIFVPTGDVERLKQIEEDLLKEKGLNCVEMNIDDLCSSAERADLSKNLKNHTQIIELRGLSEDEALSLKEKCKGIGANFAIGLDHQDNGTYNFAIKEDQAFSLNPEVKDFAYAYLTSTIDAHGAKNDIKLDKLIQEKDFVAKLENLSVQRGEEPKYIVGKNCNDRYLEITDSGFSYYSYSMEGKDIVRNVIESEDISSPEYTAKLTGCALEMKDCEIIDKAQLTPYLMEEHHDVGKKELDNLKHDENRLAAKINDIVKTKMQKDPRFKNEKDSSVLLSEYVRQSKSILDDIANNINPRGLTHDQVEDLYSFVDHSCLDRKEYRGCKKVFDRYDCDIYRCDEREQHFEKKLDRETVKEIGKDNYEPEKHAIG